MHTNRSAFVTLISVFFFWGFVAASNDILIPVFKEKLHLEQWQSQLISVAFYLAYTVGSIIYILLSKLNGGDILNRLGYKNGIALGLSISAVGTLLFYPAAELVSFNLMITGLFIVALGFSLQQTAANPLAIVMGNPKQASQRLSMAGGINNVGTTIGPLVVSFAIFGSVGDSLKLDSISSVKVPYLILGAAFLVVAVIFKFSSLPNQIFNEEEGAKPNDGESRGSSLKYPQLVLGMIAIFLYVGVEVATASNLPEYMKQYINIETSQAAPYISLFWASLMIGRWTSSAGAFETSSGLKKSLRFVMPYLAFGVFLLVNAIAKSNLAVFYPYSFVILILILADILSKGNPARQLVIFSFCGIAALITGMMTNGLMSVYAFISVGLFCSTLWPCIFTLAITGLGKYTNQGSSYLIMMIMGGGIVSWLQGWLAGPEIIGIKASYWVGVFCFAYLAFYGWKSSVILRSQGIELDAANETSH
ncbi:MFS transporter [Aurantibacillus circumpalustris]|uniref:MFS transporter n=1 Tax=Aurantibacillus circumpalustris TaxID=3036359 RepID=UPI00295B7228|nr:MFS transporter [Aurantibacillus circumpalustris]